MFASKALSIFALALTLMTGRSLQAQGEFSKYAWMGKAPNIGDFSETKLELIKNAKLNIDFECLAIDSQNRLSLVYDNRSPAQVSLLEHSSKKPLSSLPPANYQPTIAAFSGDGKVMTVDHPQKFVGDKPATIHLWRVGERPERIIAYELPDAAAIKKLMLSHTGQRVAYQRENIVVDDAITVYDTAHHKPRLVLTNESFPDNQRREIVTMALSSDGKQIAVASSLYPTRERSEQRTEVSTWNVDTMEMAVVYEGPSAVTTLAYSNSGKLIAVGGGAFPGSFPVVLVIDVETGDLVSEIRFSGHPICTGFMEHLLFGPDDKSIVTSVGGAISVWGVASAELKTTILSPIKTKHLSIDNDSITIAGSQWTIESPSFFARTNIAEPKGIVVADLDLSVAFEAHEQYKVAALSFGRMFGLKK